MSYQNYAQVYKTLCIDNAQNGTLTQQGNTKVVKLDDGQLAYNASGNSSEVLYNTITTPRGGQFQMTLSDGSKVWLNAASSMKFPVAFSGNERKVEITGEAYFEVAKNSFMPFKVEVNGKQEVEVLGTHFNINAYNDEPEVRTTLLEGKVKVNATGQSELLNPGEQAVVGKEIKILKDVDVDGVMAWKSGYFHFDHVDLQTVLNEVARWYDVRIVYEGVNVQREFVGKIQRDLNLSEVLKILEKSKVQFKIENKKLIVLPDKTTTK